MVTTNRHKEQGRREERQKWQEWNQRRQAAEAAGKQFNEPTPAEEAERDRR